MKKSILNIGKALSKADQKEINGGGRGNCSLSYCLSHCQYECVETVNWHTQPPCWECVDTNNHQ
ncbi:hypothetical protein [Pseudotenacibaculum haliotis]|uniref:Bacteriocin n=1 Tax=Pseudotenacibaculum haliotis TaxID=1862138 RepID=A0ABW5LPT4_9FLAO